MHLNDLDIYIVFWSPTCLANHMAIFRAISLKNKNIHAIKLCLNHSALLKTTQCLVKIHC